VRAIGIESFGGPDVLHLVELPDPVAGPEEICIRVTAAAVNPTDTVLRSGGRAERLKDVPPPHVPGMDAAGVVEHVGEGTPTDLAAGERVVAIVLPLGARGAYAERVVVPAESVVRAPSNADDAEAATLPMNGLTARLALDELHLDRDQTVAVTGAAGSVGGYVVQLAKAAGLRVVADAAPRDTDLVGALGADVVVPRGEAFSEGVRGAVPEGADGLVDAALLDGAALGALRDGGRMITLRGYEGRDADTRGISIVPVYVRNYARERAKLDELRRQAEQGVLSLRVARVLPLVDAPDAHRLLEAGGVRGRLVLEV
jgi:NADPH:quinone reductase-like Zn-dependent oxidoreductase